MKLGIITCLLVPAFHVVQSQISVPGMPESFFIRTKSALLIPSQTLEAIEIKKLRDEDAKYGIPNRYGIVQKVNIDIKNNGTKSLISGKGYIWQYEITSDSAYSLGIHFEKYKLPAGAKVFIYDEDHRQVFGAYTDIDNNHDNQLAIAEFSGKNAIIEYFEPFDVSFPGELQVGYVSQAYKDIQSVLSTRIGINCPEGENWQDEKHAVCRMVFSDTQYSYYCTGFLVNNVRADGTPYFQTANHCISTAAEASTLITYFNYENSSCSSSDASKSYTLSGATLKANNAYSDFSLLLLNQMPPTSYIPYYAGWDNSGRSPRAGTGIHHPGGTPKCIALEYTKSPVSYNGTIHWDNNSTTSPNTHWSVQFDKGNVESGSSGSPLFDENKRVIGQLHGGDTTESFYGKLSLSWSYSTIASKQLKVWLDPDNTGVQTLDGTMRIKPQSAFTTAVTVVCVGAIVNLNDASKYFPNQWRWSISPDSYEFANSDSTSENPKVIFKSPGNYTISLKASNIYGSDSVTVINYITANNTIKVSMSNIPVDSSLCGSLVNKYPLKAFGALKYKYLLENADKIDTISNRADSLYLTLKSDVEKYGSLNIRVKVSGEFGACKSSDSAQLKIIMQPNNNIENATRIWPGHSTLYSNQCATSQTREPHPPLTGCYTNYSWCNGSASAINHTVWFTFIGPSSGRVTLDTHGINNRIAVYSADTYSQIISGNTYSYSVLGANEGRSASDATSKLENLSVDPGKTYWLQVDGSNGAVGSFDIDLLSNSMDIFPNPSNGQFDIIISNENSGTAEVNIYSLLGKLLLTRNLEVTQDANRFSFDLSVFPSGIYVIKVGINGSTTESKLMLVK